MHLSDLKIGEKAEIVKIETDSALKQRLYSFGIVKGAIVMIEAYSLIKDTLQILVSGTDIGLRKSEAEKITVKVLESVDE